MTEDRYSRSSSFSRGKSRQQTDGHRTPRWEHLASLLRPRSCLFHKTGHISNPARETRTDQCTGALSAADTTGQIGTNHVLACLPSELCLSPPHIAYRMFSTTLAVGLS